MNIELIVKQLGDSMLLSLLRLKAPNRPRAKIVVDEENLKVTCQKAPMLLAGTPMIKGIVPKIKRVEISFA